MNGNKVSIEDLYYETSRKILNNLTFLYYLKFLLLGAILGVFSKWLDNLAIDNSVWWMNIIDKLDLANFFSEMAIWLFIALIISTRSLFPRRAALSVFLFFLGMCVSYHLYSIYVCGFNPKNYMMIWYGITIISPILAYICWYAKGNYKFSIPILCGIMYAMFTSCFSIGMWYFDFRSDLHIIVFLGTLILFYKQPINLIISVIVGLLLSFVINLPFGI